MASTHKPAWKRKATVESNARRVLSAMARDYFSAGRKVVANRPKPADLHAFRLHTKRFRYTLAMFAPLYGPSMQQRLELLKPVQDALGEVNDCIATREAFHSDEKFTAYLDRRATRKADDFYRAWKRQFDAAGQEELWLYYLEHLGETQPAIDSQNLSGNEARSS